MENQDIDLIGQTVGNMPYKIGIVDKDGNLTNQFVGKASTNRIDIPEQLLGGSSSTGGTTGGTTGSGGNAPSQVPQLPSTTNLFSGSAVGNILLSGPSADYSNIQDGLLITLGNQTSVVFGGPSFNNVNLRLDLLPIGLKPIKIPKEKLVVNGTFDISDQLSQYIGKTVQGQFSGDSGKTWNNDSSYSIVSFGGTTIKILPNTTLNMNLTVKAKKSSSSMEADGFQIAVVQVNTYKN